MMLRIPERGAIAVLASSWTNGPSGTWGQIILEELTRPGATIGEAIMRSKHRNPKSGFVNLYNLLGDPAAPTSLPIAKIDLSAEGAEEGPLTVSGVMDTDEFSGELMVELVDNDREILHSITTRLEGSDFSVDLPASTEELANAAVARVYAWDVSRSFDAAAAIDLPGKEKPAPPRQRRPRRRKKPEKPPEPIPEATAAELRADAIAWWSFDENGGTNILDRMEARHGSLVDRADRVTSPRGSALTFYGYGFLDFGAEQGHWISLHRYQACSFFHIRIPFSHKAAGRPFPR
jgi:hypothetical protein